MTMHGIPVELSNPATRTCSIACVTTLTGRLYVYGNSHLNIHGCSWSKSRAGPTDVHSPVKRCANLLPTSASHRAVRTRHPCTMSPSEDLMLVANPSVHVHLIIQGARPVFQSIGPLAWSITTACPCPSHTRRQAISPTQYVRQVM